MIEDVNWWLMALAFALGLLLTFAFVIRRVTRRVPMTESFGVGGRDRRGAGAGGGTDDSAQSFTGSTDEGVPTGRMPSAGSAAAGASAKFHTGKSGFDSASAKMAPVREEPYGPGSARRGSDGSGASGEKSAGNGDSMLYRTPDEPPYEVTQRDEKTPKRNGMPVDRQFVAASPGVDATSPFREIGSWVIASAAFMLIAFRQTDVLPYVPLGLSPARFVLFGAAGLFILTRFAGQRSRYRLCVMGPVLAIYFLSILVAYAAGVMRPSTPIGKVDSYLVREFMLILVVLVFFNVIHGYVGLTRVIKGLIAGGVVSAVLAILASFTGVEAATMLRLPGLRDTAILTADELIREGMLRPQASAAHPLELAGVLTTIFPLALGLTFSLRAQGKRCWPWAAATAIVVAGVAVSLSRSGVIGIAVALVVMAFNWPIRRTLGVLAAIGTAVAVGLMFDLPVLRAYFSILGTKDGSAEQRQAVTTNLASNIFSPFGMFGQGAGTPDNPPVLDNQYLCQLAETGIFGLLAYLTLVGTSLTFAFLAFRNARNRANTQLPAASAHLFLGLAAAITAYAILSIFLDVRGFLQIWTMLWLLIATSAVAFRLSRRPEGPKANNAAADVGALHAT